MGDLVTRKPRILLVEDEIDVLSLNSRHLEAQGYETLCAKTLAQAKKFLWEAVPDLVVLDVQMPDGSGYDFCSEIREITTAPIIFLTCLTEDKSIVRGLSSGGDDYITKPYSLDVLSARIMALLRRNRFGFGHIEMPPLHLDFLTGRVSLYGEEIDLSPKEIQLLAYFIDNAGRAFSVEELYQLLWGTDSDVKTNTVRVHISRLRNKLRMDGGSPFELSCTPDKRYMFQKVVFSADN